MVFECPECEKEIQIKESDYVSFYGFSGDFECSWCKKEFLLKIEIKPYAITTKKEFNNQIK